MRGQWSRWQRSHTCIAPPRQAAEFGVHGHHIKGANRERLAYTETHEKTRLSNKAHNKIKTTKHMVGEYTSKSTHHSSAYRYSSIHLKCHPLQKITLLAGHDKGIYGPDRCPSSQTTFNCRAKWIDRIKPLSSVHHGCATQKGRASADMARGGSSQHRTILAIIWTAFQHHPEGRIGWGRIWRPGHLSSAEEPWTPDTAGPAGTPATEHWWPHPKAVWWCLC